MSAVLLGSTLMGCAGKAGTSGEAQGDPKKETQAQSRGGSGKQCGQQLQCRRASHFKRKGNLHHCGSSEKHFEGGRG